MLTKKIKCLECINCKEIYTDLNLYNCPNCSGNLEIIFDYDFLKTIINKDILKQNNEFNIWRYESLLPLKNIKNKPLVQIGGTPLYDVKVLAEKIGVSKLYIKDDGRNPSASFKDRASSVAIINAIERKEKILCGASTGNAASSTACLAASTNIKLVIFVPETAPKAKIAQLLVFGADVITVKGTYDDAFDLSLEASKEFGWYNRNTGYNPYTREGKKTCSYEIAEQLNWNVPDKIFVSVGDGNIISGIWKGWKDLYNLGFIKKLPKLIAVQAQYSNAIQKAFKSSNGKIQAVSGKTVADSISVSIPRDGQSAVNAIKESKGDAITVTDKAIISGIKELAQGTGVFAEPAGAATYAGILKYKQIGKLNKKDKIVAVITGNGLKDVESAMKSVGKPFSVEPSLKSLKNVLKKIKV